MNKHDPRLINAVRSIESAAQGIPLRDDLEAELAIVERAQQRGWFTPDEDEMVRTRYSQYLSSRTALLITLEQIESTLRHAHVKWSEHLPAFTAAFTAACLMVRGSSFIIELAKKRPVIWKKLDEPEPRFGLPRSTFSNLHKAATDRRRRQQFQFAIEFFQQHREEILSMRADPIIAPLIHILQEEEQQLAWQQEKLWRRRMFYRWFSFLSSHRSGYRRVMFHLFRWSGSAIAELRQPGVKPSGAPKRISTQQREELLALARPGDVFVTRHDDAMSNLFLPGFWPHAALHLGDHHELEQVIGKIPAPIKPRYKEHIRFLEAKKDGVRFRPAEETLHVDACLLLRPPLHADSLRDALARSLSHEGKKYDFLFDFRTTDRLACTEVIYRTYHGYSPISFELIAKAGRVCIPAENLIDQALACGFTLVATCNVTPFTIHQGEAALADLASSRGQVTL